MAEPPVRDNWQRAELLLERVIFNARWLMAPFYLGLVVSLGLLLVVFVRELAQEFMPALNSPEAAILLVLTLIDLSLAGNLVLIVTLSGYENFVSKIDTGGHVDRPDWMGTINFSGMKIKLVASIVAISGVSLLRYFMSIAGGPGPHGETGGVDPDTRRLVWLVGLHMVFVVSGVLFAVMDWLAEKTVIMAERHHRATD